ncbi:hypothetical protein KKC87_04500 [Patescibacteria group bacterium]|nr:hypothetical protein [Patescibacteria group bacterium]
MASEFATAYSQFIQENTIWIIIIVAVIIGLIYLYKLLRSVPKQPDYVRIFRDKMIQDEKYNKPDARYGIRRVYRGEQLIGSVASISENIFGVSKIMMTEKNFKWDKIPRENVKVYTIAFKPPLFKILGFQLFSFKKEILKFTERDRWKIKERGHLVFPSDVGFTSLGHVYATQTSYRQLSRVIEDEFNKRLFEVNTQLFASRMTQISAETPEMSHELALKRLEIEKIKAEKQLKLGSIV